MAWGDGFVSAWNSATGAARSAVSAVATGVKDVADATANAVQKLAREAQVIAKTAEHAVESAAKTVASAAVSAAEKAKAAAQWAAKETEKAVKLAAQKGVEAAKVTAKAVATAYKATKKAFSTAAASAATAACAVENWVVGGIAMTAGAVLSKPPLLNLLRPLLKLGGNASQKPFDGDVLGSGCKKRGATNPGGVMPEGCRQPPGSLPKISYVNGINTVYTDPQDPNLFSGGICKTMQGIANATCSEVIGVYNATEGMGKDLDECIDNIAKASHAPAVVPLRNMMVEAARSKQPMTLFAHSQGGLITQEAVAKAKQQLMNEDNLTSEEAEQALSVVSVKSFGTALMGWPKGPHYERFTNTADPVPPVITGAQTSFPIATWKDSASAEAHDVFTDPHVNPIGSHSIDDTYLPEYQRVKGAPHCACKAA